ARGDSSGLSPASPVRISISSGPISLARSETISAWYRSTVAMVAATGTARKAPMMPASAEPTVTDSKTMAACKPIALDCKTGCSTLPSTCWTIKISAKTSSALTRPLETSAITTARTPAVSTDNRDKAGEEGNNCQHERQRHAQGPQAQTNEESIDKSDRCLRLDKSSQRLPHAGKQLSDVPANGRTGVLAYPRQKAVSVFQNEKGDNKHHGDGHEHR